MYVGTQTAREGGGATDIFTDDPSSVQSLRFIVHMYRKDKGYN